MDTHTLTTFISTVLVALFPVASAVVAGAIAWVAKWAVTHIKSQSLRDDVASAVNFVQQTIPLKSARYTEAANAVHAFWPNVEAGKLQTLIEDAVATAKLTHPDWEALPPSTPPQAPQPESRVVAPGADLADKQMQQMRIRAEATVAAAKPAEPQGNLIDTKVIRLPAGTMTITTHLEPISTTIDTPTGIVEPTPQPQGV